MIIYRPADALDVEQVALLHANSWRRTYRGLFTDKFLDHEADADRRNVWRGRLTNNRPDQYVRVAEEGGVIVGFVCAYGHEDDTWGSLIDNMHVAPEKQRQGVGSQLMAHAFAWLRTHFPVNSVYLWVMERNNPARRFYEKLGASNAGMIDKANPVGGGSAFNCRYVWPGVKAFIK